MRVSTCECPQWITQALCIQEYDFWTSIRIGCGKGSFCPPRRNQSQPD